VPRPRRTWRLPALVFVGTICPSRAPASTSTSPRPRSTARSRRANSSPCRRPEIVYAVVDDSLSPTSPLGDAVETYIRREDAERFIQDVRGDNPELRGVLVREHEWRVREGLV
jgi:hypothetical protein